MILVREVFQLQFGKARDVLAILDEGREIERRHGFTDQTVMTDLTGEFYTLVMETRYPALADMERAMSELSQDPAWREWYAKLTPLVREGRREIYRVME